MGEEITSIHVCRTRLTENIIVSTDGPRLVAGALSLHDALHALAFKIEEHEAGTAREECRTYPDRNDVRVFTGGAAA